MLVIKIKKLNNKEFSKLFLIIKKITLKKELFSFFVTKSIFLNKLKLPIAVKPLLQF